MQDLKIYIVIEDQRTKHDLSIKENFEVLRAFLNSMSDTVARAHIDALPMKTQEIKQGRKIIGNHLPASGGKE